MPPVTRAVRPVLRNAHLLPHMLRSSARAFRTSPGLFGADPVVMPDHLSAAERAIFEKLRTKLEPSALDVQDISGGCGSMYGLDIVSSRFTGLSVIKQHKMVNEVLKEEIKGWHGVQLKTKAP